jgi:hypothetical protein
VFYDAAVARPGQHRTHGLYEAARCSVAAAGGDGVAQFEQELALDVLDSDVIDRPQVAQVADILFLRSLTQLLPLWRALPGGN